MFPDLKLLTLNFWLRPRNAGYLPPFVGTTLRGVFGHALKRFFCFVPDEDCPKCWFKAACPYQTTFEATPHSGILHPKLKGKSEMPQPFLLRPPLPVRVTAGAGSGFNDHFSLLKVDRENPFVFSLTLMGDVARHWAQIIVAVRIMANAGLSEGSVRFDLERVSSHDCQGVEIEVFSDRVGEIVNADSVGGAGIDSVLGLMAYEDGIRDSFEGTFEIEFLTPMRLRVSSLVSADLDFMGFVKKASERLEFCSNLYAKGRNWTDYRDLVSSIGKVRCEKNQVEILEFKQYSNRQARHTKRPVAVGSMTFEGSVSKPVLDVLRAGQLLNIGSNASAGFGHFRINFGDNLAE